MGQQFTEAQGAATQAYLAVWRSHGVKFARPITQMRDKHWSEMLRAAWPHYTTVDIKKSSVKQSEMISWCDAQDTSYWVNGGGDRWYFERRDIAALFKLTFGGAQ